MTPNDRRYAKTHEWAKLADGIVTVGITDHAQEALGDITFVELPVAGTTVAAGAEFGVIESVKAASDLYAPVGGEIVEINGALEAEPELVNHDPYGDGWIVRIRCEDEGTLTGLLDAAGYDSQLEQE
jgi:glycine cleavage system H protein